MKVRGITYCINCMRQIEGQDYCPYCGSRQGDEDSLARYLTPGTILEDRYVLGKVLGQGSFGITYIGRDLLLDSVIAVKEYFPKHHVHRNAAGEDGFRVCLYEDEKTEEYEQMMGKFLDEAKRLTQFREIEGIVSVQDFFYENNTAYMVMDYIEGVCLKEYIEEKGPMKGEWVLEHVDPLLSALEKIHEKGLIHRDISPDNIIVRPDSRFELIDFGSAREANEDRDKSLTVVFKRGFSPAEQYRSRGEQGIWSDVYSICATIYFCLTGTVPDEALERVFVDEMPSLLTMPEVDLDRRQKKAVMKGISVRAQERYSDIRELRVALRGQDKGQKKRKILCMAVTAVVLILILISGKALNQSAGQETESQRDVEAVSPATSMGVPVVSGSASEAAVEDRQDEAEKKYKVPNVMGLDYKTAKEKLEKRKLKVTVKKMVSGEKKDTVISQSVKKGKLVKKGTKILLKVSKGKTVLTATPKPTSVPTPVPTASPTRKPSSQKLDGMID